MTTTRTTPLPLPPAIEELLRGRPGLQRVYKGSAGTKALLSRAAMRLGSDALLVARDSRERAELAGLLQLLTTAESGPDELAPAWERPWIALPGCPPPPGDHRVWPRRLAALFGLAMRSKPRITLATTDCLLLKLPPRDFFEGNHLELTANEEMAPEMILEQAVSWGYERVQMVTRPGEMALRGDILDIFTPGYELALRVEFFGDTVEEMRLFDPSTQRSHKDAARGLERALILPAAPCLGSPAEDEQVKDRWRRWAEEGLLTEEQAADLLRGLEAGERTMPPGLYYESPSSLEDWLRTDAVCITDGEDRFAEDLDEVFWAWDTAEEAGKKPKGLSVRDPQAVQEMLERRRRIQFPDLTLGSEKDGVDMAETRYDSFEELFPVARGRDDGEGAEGEQRRDRPWHTLVEALKRWERERPQTVLGFHSVASRRKFLKLAEEEGVHPRLTYSPFEQGLFALVSPFSGGLDLAWANSLILAEDILQPAAGRRPPPPDKGFKGLTARDELVPEELLVHRDYGLGRFQGLVHMSLGDTVNDFLLVHYSGDDKLYLPVDRMGMVQRYKGPDGAAPALDKLGGVGWMRTREKARKAVEKIAKDLVEMYAFRKVAKGYAYEPPGEMYREFEASFGFEETPDQDKAIQDVLQDMGRTEPMDRLVCGDVGFGKTEVALRAAFRAAIEGKQVALLCPTTVLAEQHYQTFRTRMRDFPVNVAMLSRFVPPKRQKAVAEAVTRGQVDVLIGTHRILSKDISFPNLGLLVLDEEQRFGVKHKEKLKQLRKNVDSLTLTATPIPRTLQLSLSGIRGLSLIETPPQDRKPVQTSLLTRDEGELRAVLRRELEREGQVFWVYNRVQGLERVVEYVRKLAPEARVGMAHGQMKERNLEEAMHAFWHGELDVLVCTAIIESGLDFPRANTLVVDGAHMFGLGQLYQLRGRVGRSERQAYAHFVVPDLDRLPDQARKRLRIILDMDYLGAGFKVAMEDLRLRGAGNILGEAQSGQIAKVGLDLFLEMLEEEVRRVQGEPMRQETEPELTIGFEARIPEFYVEDSRERLRLYKALTSALTHEERADIVAGIRDRFGPLPQPLVDFVALLSLKRLLGALQVSRAEVFPAKVKLSWPEEAGAVSPVRLVEWVADHADKARMIPPATLELRFDQEAELPERFARAEKQLSELLAEEPATSEE